MRVQLLFMCYETRKTATDGQGGVRLGAATAIKDHPLEEEMKSFWKYTPAGSLEFNSINKAAVESFEPGKLYRITIEPAE